MKSGFGFADYLLYVRSEGARCGQAKADGTLTSQSAVGQVRGRPSRHKPAASSAVAVSDLRSEWSGPVLHQWARSVPRSRPIFGFPGRTRSVTGCLRVHSSADDAERRCRRSRRLQAVEGASAGDSQPRTFMARADSRALVRWRARIGKTFTAVQRAYRLLYKFGGARRILFLRRSQQSGQAGRGRILQFQRRRSAQVSNPLHGAAAQDQHDQPGRESRDHDPSSACTRC